jgi:aspartyl-tRNA(Asn)/glutamyl-tRNA(Gln) amidotransferase subunit C
MKLTIEQVEHIAALARLDLKPEEKALFLKQLSSILEYVDQLGRVDTSATEPMNHSVAVENVLRPDEVAACGEDVRRRLIGEFPDKDGDLLKVPAVFS